MAKNTEVTLRGFSISSTLLSEDSDGMFARLKETLENSIVKDRIMRLNQGDETAESDLISSFQSNCETELFAIMMRVAIGADDSYIDKELLSEKCFPVDKIRKKTNNAAALYRNHYYICISKTHLVTNLPLTTTISRVENYLNWLLKTHNYVISPVVVSAPDLKLSDIKSVKFTSNAISGCSVKQSEDVIQNRFISIKNELFRMLCADSASLEDIDLKQIVSAELVLKLIKPRQMSEAEYQKKYSAIMKPVSDNNGIVFLDKKGNKINGEDILRTKKINVEKTDQGWLSEPQLHSEMARFLDELAQ